MSWGDNRPPDPVVADPDAPEGDHWISLGEAAAKIVADLSFQRRVEKLHRKGPRVIAEFLGEIAARHSLQMPIELLLDRYSAIDDCALEATGGDRFPPPPIHGVES